MKDKVEQRERTEALVGGAKTFNDFVKEKAEKNKLTPACVRSLPEVKEEWKQLKEKEKAEKKAQAEAKKAEKTADKKAQMEAKKAEKKALADAKKAEKQVKKAEKKVVKEVKAEKTAIKKVAKKADENAENIKLLIVEKAHKVAKAQKPPEEPKVKGRPKKYATPEEARRAKIEQTKAINKAKKEAKKASEPPKEPKAPKEKKEKPKKIKWHPDVYDAELKVYTARSHDDLDAVIKIIRKVFNNHDYEMLDAENKKSFDHTIAVYNQKREALFKKEREEEARIEKEQEERAKERRAEMEREIIKRRPQMQKNIEMFRKARERAQQRKSQGIPVDYDLEEGEIYEGRGYNPADLKEFKNYGKIQEHLGQHLNDLKEAIDPKDVRDYIYFTKEKARLKKKLIGGLIGAMDSDSDSDSESDNSSVSDEDIRHKYRTQMEGGGDFFGNIKRAFTTAWNKPVQSEAERKALDATLNYFEPAVLAPLSVIAPPVAQIGEAQRKLMKSKAGV